MEQDGLLRDDAELRPERRDRHVAQVHSIHGDAPGAQVVEAREQVHRRALPRPAATDQRHDIAAPDLEAHLLQHRLPGLVGEAHAFVANAILESGKRVGPGGVHHRGGRIEQPEEPRARRHALLDVGVHLGQALERRDRGEQRGHEQDELLRGAPRGGQ